MIYLAIDGCCHDCDYFKVEDIVNGAGDHILSCSFRQTCWEKQRTYLTSCDGDICSVEAGLSGLEDEK